MVCRLLSRLLYDFGDFLLTLKHSDKQGNIQSSENTDLNDDGTDVPKHVAIIMDGNGRWARERYLPRFRGHREGIKRVREITREAGKRGVQYLTLYAFSEENWLRPQREVQFLMKLLNQYLMKYGQELLTDNVRLKVIGDLSRLPSKSQVFLKNTVQRLNANTGLVLTLALSYSGRKEIVETTRSLVQKAQDGLIDAKDIDEKLFRSEMQSSYLPDPDLLIRTSGEVRISNFLLFQLAYTEMSFPECLWPQFGPSQFGEALKGFSQRQRRFGKINSETKSDSFIKAGNSMMSKLNINAGGEKTC
jgi:undecaprenyl diphosphate synthase